jgi:hypothetical protein
MDSGDPGALEREWIPLGSVIVTGGDTAEMVVVLPESYSL